MESILQKATIESGNLGEQLDYFQFHNTGAGQYKIQIKFSLHFASE